MYLDVSAMSVHMRHTKWQNMVKHRNLLPWVDAFLLIYPYSHYKAKLHHRAEGMILWPSPYVMDEKDKVFTGKTTNLMIKLALYYLHCMLSSSWCCETSKKSVCQKSFLMMTFVRTGALNGQTVLKRCLIDAKKKSMKCETVWTSTMVQSVVILNIYLQQHWMKKTNLGAKH